LFCSLRCFLYSFGVLKDSVMADLIVSFSQGSRLMLCAIALMMRAVKSSLRPIKANEEGKRFT
jgi:hypothetical protein